MCVFRVDTTPVCAEPGSFIPQATLCAFSAPCTRAGIRQHSHRFSMLRSALNSLIWDKRHPSEQSLRKWFGFSEHPGVLGFCSREERTSGSGEGGFLRDQEATRLQLPGNRQDAQTPMNSECKLSSSSWLAHYNKDLQTLSSVLNPRQGD